MKMDDKLKRGWISMLESLRYDVTRLDPLQAHKEYGTHHVVDVTLDTSGQIRMTVTRQVGETQNVKRKSKSGRAYQLFVEQNAVTIANYRLHEGDDLVQVLNEMEKEIANS